MAVLCVQSPTYSLVGIAPGPTYFSLDTATGAITVQRSLRSDPARLTFYRVSVLPVPPHTHTHTL